MNWRVRAVADINGDGKPDVIWHHLTQGWVAVWTMDGRTRDASDHGCPHADARGHLPAGAMRRGSVRLRARLVRGLIGFILTCVVAAPASAQEQIEYYGLDHLGSVRVIFDPNGTVVDRMDYGPFGENLRSAIRFPPEQFAQLARDAETGQDYAQARNYVPSTGRFNRIDPVYAGLFNPQAWNRYAYALNNTLRYIDPFGTDPQNPPPPPPAPGTPENPYI